MYKYWLKLNNDFLLSLFSSLIFLRKGLIISERKRLPVMKNFENFYPIKNLDLTIKHFCPRFLFMQKNFKDKNFILLILNSPFGKIRVGNLKFGPDMGNYENYSSNSDNIQSWPQHTIMHST